MSNTGVSVSPTPSELTGLSPTLLLFPNFVSSERSPSTLKVVENDKWIQELLRGG